MMMMMMIKEYVKQLMHNHNGIVYHQPTNAQTLNKHSPSLSPPQFYFSI